jgi:hypothetical protein
MVNYNNGKIYKIEPLNAEKGDVYIGLTTMEYLSQRMAQHKSKYKHYLKDTSKNKDTRSIILFEKYGVENCYITLIENVNVNSFHELKAREDYHIRKTECVNRKGLADRCFFD